MNPYSISDFTNPLESKIIELEQLYSKGIAEDRPFEEMKQLKMSIKLLKSELGIQRGQDASQSNTTKLEADK